MLKKCSTENKKLNFYENAIQLHLRKIYLLLFHLYSDRHKTHKKLDI